MDRRATLPWRSFSGKCRYFPLAVAPVPAAHCLLPTTCCPLPLTACFPLPAASTRCLLSAACCPLPAAPSAAHCLLSTTCPQVVHIAHSFSLASAASRLKPGRRRGSTGVRPVGVPLPVTPGEDPIWLKARRKPMTAGLSGSVSSLHDRAEYERQRALARASSVWHQVLSRARGSQASIADAAAAAASESGSMPAAAEAGPAQRLGLRTCAL
ncbi:hypothetical protein T492DRAFT_190698 [Pavlovales sp. CCMP2436]|nr:hypothetical protein T492DRAFT_190698 [Pavlovales sp. CCMP2436]